MQETSILDRYGDNFTKKVYITNPAIGREEEIKELCLILLTPDKSAILTGKPGIGKTALVEGLAYRIQNNDVPDALKGYEIIKIDTQSLMGTVMATGESKVQTLVDELKKRGKCILFIDEIHTLINKSDETSLDFANMFKTGLGRGDIKIIGATTTDEYQRYILKDKAFTRRFKKIEMREPTPEETVKILMGTLPKIEANTKAKMAYTSFVQSEIMKFIVDVNKPFNRVYESAGNYPDVALTMLSACFSEALFENKDVVTVVHVAKAIENATSLYEDVRKKEAAKFREQFKKLFEQEEQMAKDFRVEGSK